MPLCECGCGAEVKDGKRFIRGHHRRNLSDEAKAKISEANKGRKHSEEARKKMSEANLGKKLSDETKRKISEALKGKKLSDETKYKMSEAMKGKNLGNQNMLGHKHTEEAKRKMSGENASNWKGGISFVPYCHKFNNSFKESIRDKFDRKCFLCGKDEEENSIKLDVHHVNYDKECLCEGIKCEFVPLCRSCRSKTSNGDREYWENLIMEKLLVVN